jgi:hypothetical protein
LTMDSDMPLRMEKKDRAGGQTEKGKSFVGVSFRTMPCLVPLATAKDPGHAYQASKQVEKSSKQMGQLRHRPSAQRPRTFLQPHRSSRRVHTMLTRLYPRSQSSYSDDIPTLFSPPPPAASQAYAVDSLGAGYSTWDDLLKADLEHELADSTQDVDEIEAQVSVRSDQPSDDAGKRSKAETSEVEMGWCYGLCRRISLYYAGPSVNPLLILLNLL